jgi:hypothetical protein
MSTDQIISDWTTWSKKKTQQLRECIHKGIPQYLRPIVWQYLCGAQETNLRDTYKEYLKKTSTCEKVIRRDVDRTYPDQDLFRNGNGQEMLFNIMKAYSIYDPEVGYCQGSAFITGLLLIQVTTYPFHVLNTTHYDRLILKNQECARGRGVRGPRSNNAAVQLARCLQAQHVPFGPVHVSA